MVQGMTTKNSYIMPEHVFAREKRDSREGLAASKQSEDVRVPEEKAKGPRSSFTLVELLSTIAIMAVLVVGITAFVANYVTWAKNTSDKQTYTVLNDALGRYKCEGAM